MKIKKSRKDFYVPSNEEMLVNYNKIKHNPTYELVYLVLVTSGIRFIECLDFLKNYDEKKFAIHPNYVSYNVSDLRHTKNINNIYLPLFVYKKLKRVNSSYNSLRQKYKHKGCTFSLKYLRKWHYNFLLYNNVPESVADFIQGRASKSISANHYLAKAQQVEHWYPHVALNLEKLLYTGNLEKD
ncbi:hypothetical protein HQ533_01555 [Candidatus Woesearchaeota archaeon]|nr:hypothetical protein [Candidatus Woesearchaeota archaeon]